MKTLILLLLSLPLTQDLHALDLGKFLKKMIGVEEKPDAHSPSKEVSSRGGGTGSCWEDEIKSASPWVGMPRGSSGKRIICGPTFYGLWALDEVVDEEILTEEQMMAELGIQRRSVPAQEDSEPSKYKRHHIRFPKREYSDDPWHTTYVKISGPMMRCGTYLRHEEKKRPSSFNIPFLSLANAQPSSNSQGPLTDEERRNLAGYVRQASDQIRQELLGRLTGWGESDGGRSGFQPGTEAWSYHEDTVDTLDWLCHELDPDACACPSHLRGLCDFIDREGGLDITRTDLGPTTAGAFTGFSDGRGIEINYRIDTDYLPDFLDTLVHEASHGLDAWFGRSVALPDDLETYQDESTAFIVESVFHQHLDGGPYSSAFEADDLTTYRDLMAEGGDVARLSVMLGRLDHYFDHIPAGDRFRYLSGLEREFRDLGGFDGKAERSRIGFPAVTNPGYPLQDRNFVASPLRAGPGTPENLPPAPRSIAPQAPRRSIGHRENLRDYDDPDHPNVMPLPAATNTPSDDMTRSGIDSWCWDQMSQSRGGPCPRIQDQSLDNSCGGLRGGAEDRCRRRLQRRSEEQGRARTRHQAREDEEDRIRQECLRSYGTCERACQQVGSRERCGWVPTGGRRTPPSNCLVSDAYGNCVQWEDEEANRRDDGDGGGGGAGGSDRPPPPEEAYGGEEGGGDSGDCSGGDSDSEDGLLSIFFCW